VYRLFSGVGFCRLIVHSVIWPVCHSRPFTHMVYFHPVVCWSFSGIGIVVVCCVVFPL